MSENTRRKRPGLGALVLTGFGLGIACGLFFGDMMAIFADIGRAYVRLLQMAVIPYITVSLVAGLGRLSPPQAIRIATWGGLVMLTLLATGMGLMLMAPLGYPDWEAASYFSSSLLGSAADVDFVSLYITANPFDALANTVVPAIVLFSLIMGTALMISNRKGPLLELLASLDEVLMNITSFVVKLAPIGIFAIAANAAGTLDIAAFDRLQVFIWNYLLLWGLFFFLLLPGLLIAFTPVRYRELFRECRIVFVTAFVTGSSLVVLPMLIERVNHILSNHELADEETEASVDVLVPTTYNFPSVAMLLVLSFVLFAGWYSGTSLPGSKYPQFASVGLFVAFGGSNIALPFLLDMFRLPADMFQLFLVANVVNNFFFTALSAMNMTVLVTLTMFLIKGRIKFIPRYVLAFLGVLFIATPLLLKGQAMLIDRVMDYKYSGYQEFVSRSLIKPTVDVSIREYDPRAALLSEPVERLVRIRREGVLRVGYLPDALPWIFRNLKGEFVGYDMEWLTNFARDLKVNIEMVRMDSTSIGHALDSGQIDLFASGQIMDPAWAQFVATSRPYHEVTLALLVRDHRRSEFDEVEKIRRQMELKLAVTRSVPQQNAVQEAFPSFEVSNIDSPRGFLEGNTPEVDAVIMPAETASAWTLVYPDHTVVVPEPTNVRLPVVVALPRGDTTFRLYTNDWLHLAESVGRLDDYYNRWILGRNTADMKPRWSVIRDVLGWVE